MTDQPHAAHRRESDGFNMTVVLDCGDSFRLNSDPRFPAAKVGDWDSCSRHSRVIGYDPTTGQEEYDRDRRVVEVRTDG